MTDTTTKNTKPLVAATVAVTVVLVGALVAAVWFGVGWARAAFVEKPKADARESALADARQAAINLNSFDAANLDRSFADIQSSITGDLTKDLDATRDQLTKQTQETGARSTAEVLGATLTTLNSDDGTADAMIVLATTTTWPDQSSRKVRVTMRLTMTEDDDGVWRASKSVNLGNAAVLDQTPAPNATPPAPDAPADSNAPAESGTGDR
ncbi:mammalian cell entry protein [Rhodococcus sp. SGAir0479]|uniref:mammalian cell entry protein n=1 Tax=Rhodococcus sp. SGAir0479 TaxID=2567884 RepID=UPI0010CCE921|nr:mammalian cell entry protein [Rhodococcus sp. SGAir0479]QCQ92259.1 mammalian cell entry protein [Rhodococcus sp. SGAir0479]